MNFRDSYEIPEALVEGGQTQAFAWFLHNWFADPRALLSGDLDITFLEELAPAEVGIARELIRRNLQTKHVHIIEGTSALRDAAAVPVLRSMLKVEEDLSRRLTIAGALWKLVSDSAFVDCLIGAKTNADVMTAHLNQVMWLGDDRAVAFLIDLLDHASPKVRAFALMQLNELEFGRGVTVPPPQLTSQPEDYRQRRGDPVFVQAMVRAIQERNSRMKNGK
jgi:hypothetical protein